MLPGTHCNANKDQKTATQLDGKTWLLAHIAKQYKRYTMAVESWESVQGNQNVPLWHEVCFWALADGMHKTFTIEIMDVSGLWDLNKKKAEELLYHLVFVRSPGSERWPGIKKRNSKIACIGMWPRVHFLDLQCWYVFCTTGLTIVELQLQRSRHGLNNRSSILAIRPWIEQPYLQLFPFPLQATFEINISNILFGK